MSALTECCQQLGIRTARSSVRISTARIGQVFHNPSKVRSYTAHRDTEDDVQTPKDAPDSGRTGPRIRYFNSGPLDASDESWQERAKNNAERRAPRAPRPSPKTKPLMHVGLSDLPRSLPRPSSVIAPPKKQQEQQLNDRIWIALGSNVGDPFANVEAACRCIDEDPDMRILETSPLYVTRPMYVENQASFLNGVCSIETKLEPLELLDRLQAIENGLGRVKTIDKGPRNIDLDILLYKDRTVQHERLTIPHIGMTDREFVLRPLADTSARNEVSFQHKNGRIRTVLASLRLLWDTKLKTLGDGELPEMMFPHVPLTHNRENDYDFLNPTRSTKIMSIINVTPDSFSDGGKFHDAEKESKSEHGSISEQRLRETMLSHIVQGAHILDIGGQSSRPGAVSITSEEEIARIKPALEIAQTIPEVKEGKVAISVDTYRAAVAEAAVRLGATIINDVSAGMLDPGMLPTIANLGCTYIMGHTRGTPETMKDLEGTYYSVGGATGKGATNAKPIESYSTTQSLHENKSELNEVTGADSSHSTRTDRARSIALENANEMLTSSPALGESSQIEQKPIASTEQEPAAPTEQTPVTAERSRNVLIRRSNSNIVEVVAQDLEARVAAAMEAGIRRWRIILDPGLGFAKCTVANVEIIRKFHILARNHEAIKHYPWTIGLSRKRFVGDLLGGRQAGDRAWGSAAATAACVLRNAQIVRVHDVQEMADVVKVADALRT